MSLEIASPVDAREPFQDLACEPAGDLPVVLVVSDYPPAKGGVGLSSCIILARLFEDYPQDRIAYVALDCHTRSENLPSFIPASRMHTIVSAPESAPARLSLNRILKGRGFERTASLINNRLHRYFSARIRELAERYNAQLIFSTPLQQGALFRAAVSVCRDDRIPLAAYFLDDWVSAHKAGQNAKAAVEWQAEAMRTASQLYFIGPGMQSAYREKYGVESEMLTQLVDTKGFYWRPMNYDGIRPLRIVFTGTLYGAQADAFHVLLEALDKINAEGREPRILLDLYSNCSHRSLESEGRSRSYITAHGAIPASVVPFVLAAGDLLYLPLSFKPEWKLVASTSVPGKLPEYLASGRPILVHAPPYADVTKICRENGSAVVVDDPDPSILAETLSELIDDPDRLSLLGTISKEAAAAYDQTRVQRALYRSLKSIARPRAGVAI
jgi:glycosyltransferase involved in cell wall biosynthesis